MRRAIALATATMAWVLLIQAASMAMAPPAVIELSPVDVSQSFGDSESTLEPELASVTTSTLAVRLAGSSTTTTTTTSSTTTSASTTTTTAAPSTTTSQAVTVTTAPRPSTTTTTRAPSPATTTTRAPSPTTTTTRAVTATTAAPVTTTTVAPPVTTTTAVPPTTTAPPATTTTVAAATGSFSAAAESDFASRINGLRGSLGLAGLSGNGELNNYARWWAKQMADTGNFAHSNIASLLNPWTVVGENIGYGPSVNSVFNALVASAGHYKNMVDVRFTAVGVGAYVDASGRIWTAHVFGG